MVGDLDKKTAEEGISIRVRNPEDYNEDGGKREFCREDIIAKQEDIRFKLELTLKNILYEQDIIRMYQERRSQLIEFMLGNIKTIPEKTPETEKKRMMKGVIQRTMENAGMPALLIPQIKEEFMKILKTFGNRI